MSINQRIGRFRIRYSAVRDEPKDILEIMAKCIVVRAELMYERNCFEYTALSDEFDQVPEGSIAPEYMWLCEEGEWSAQRKGA